jgi:hypothetical protein
VITDPTADYGTVQPGATVTCSDCYGVAVDDPSPRPAFHWDASAREQVGAAPEKLWVLHVGRTFDDVAITSSYYRFIERLVHNSVTGGCAAGHPAGATTREQMPVFVLVAREGPGYTPAACTSPAFNDVPANSPYCPFIEDLSRRGIVTGCGNGNYCPGAAVTREQMAVFVLRTLDPALNPLACTTPVFGDVPATSPFCPWIEELARRGIVAGCGGGDYCPTDSVTREQMGVFISATFGLTLYGP